MKFFLMWVAVVVMGVQANAQVLFECINLENGLTWSFERLDQPAGAFELVEHGARGERNVLFRGDFTFWSEATNMDTLIVYQGVESFMWANLYHVYRPGTIISGPGPFEVIERVPSVRFSGPNPPDMGVISLTLCSK